jgi:hypothetical protein
MALVTDGFIDDTLPITDLPIIFWNNLVTISNVTTLQGASDPDFPITNVANTSLASKWKQDFSDSPYGGPTSIFINTNASLINYVAIAGHNLGSSGATVALEGDAEPSGSSPDNNSPEDVEWITGFQPTDDSPIIMMFGEVEAPTIKIRLLHGGGTTSTTPMEIAVIFVGYATVMDEGIQADHTPLPLAKTRKSVIGQSENGSFLGRIVLGEWVQSTATFANLESPWVRDELIPFLEYAAEYPFFYAWSPNTYPDEVAFAWMDGDPVPSFDIDGYASISFDMKGVVE